jgi:hypothetical protein
VQDLLCAPRPLACGAPRSALEHIRRRTQLSDYDLVLSSEYGAPSSHTALSIVTFIGIPVLLYIHSPGFLNGGPAELILALGCAVSAFIAFGRMYSCMHSPFDVATGAVVAVIVMAASSAAAPSVLAWMHTAPVATVVGQSALLAAGAVSCYPKPLLPTPSITDIIAFLGAVLGVSIGSALVRAEKYEQQPLRFGRAWDLANFCAQAMLGVALSVLAKLATRRGTTWALGAAFAMAPPQLRRLWQLPMHGVQQVLPGASSGL